MALSSSSSADAVPLGVAPGDLGMIGAGSVSLWAKADGGVYCAFGSNPTSPDSDVFTIFNVSSAPWVRINTVNDTNVTINAGSWPNDVWVHVCATYDGAQLEVFFDGVSVGTAVATGNLLSGAGREFYIGRRGTFSTSDYWAWQGELAEVACWSEALTAAEAVSLAKGRAANGVRPQSLSLYVPLVKDIKDVMGAAALSVSRTMVDHPRIYL